MDLQDHPFYIHMQTESYVSPGEREWLKWAKAVEKIMGHDIDGNQERDGYSIDYAYAAWEAGDSARVCAEEFIIDRNRKARRWQDDAEDCAHSARVAMEMHLDEGFPFSIYLADAVFYQEFAAIYAQTAREIMRIEGGKP